MLSIRCGSSLHRQAASCSRNTVRPAAGFARLSPACAPMCPIRHPSTVVLASSPDTEEARSPLDAPQEWEAPTPSRRPDIFPEFEKLDQVILPKMPLPGDPELPDEEVEQERKRTEPGDPDPESKPGEPSEPEPEEGDSSDPEKGTNIPTVPE